MSKKIPKIVDTNHYHLWTDALHGRALSHQALNKWDRGTYVRWTVITAWIALEIACQDTLEEPKISYSFRKNLDEAVNNKALAPLDWSQGVWHKVLQLQNLRKNYAHRFISEKNLFPKANVADNAIQIVRSAIREIYIHARKTPPTWVDDDFDRGWEVEDKTMGHLTLGLPPGVDEDDPNIIRIAYVMKGKEYISDECLPGTDPKPHVEELLRNIIRPISAIRVYRGKDLIEERIISMRGT